MILSTAFVHLLQDAFDRLQDPHVKQYTDIGRWTGLIVQVSPSYRVYRYIHDFHSLSSLLVIFFIECMHSYPTFHRVHRLTCTHRHLDGLCGQSPLVRLRTLYPKDKT